LFGLTTIDRVRCALRRRAERSAADRRTIRLLKSELRRAIAEEAAADEARDLEGWNRQLQEG
jgi:hypothetical protein